MLLLVALLLLVLLMRLVLLVLLVVVVVVVVVVVWRLVSCVEGEKETDCRCVVALDFNADLRGGS